MGNRRVPAVRFAGFDGEWEEKKLSDLVTPIKREIKKPNKPYKKLSIRSHGKGTFHQIIVDPTTVSMDYLYVVKENDLIVNITFAWEHAIAVASLNDDGLLVSHRFPTFIIDKSDINFIKFSVLKEDFRRKMELISPGGAGRNRVLNKTDFINLEITTPGGRQEQTQIGNFFKQLDDTIALKQRELENLKQTKQGFLQKMFPKEGERIPEIRFAGFHGDWEEKKLEALVEKVKSYSLSRDVETIDFTGYKYVHYGDIHKKVADKVDEYSDLPNIKQGTYELLKKGDLVVADASEDYQGIATPCIITIDTPYKLVAGLHTIALRPKESDSLFLYYLLNSSIFKKYGYKTGTGMKVFGISFTNLVNFESVIPSKEEQTQIANFFKTLDDTLRLQERILEAMKQTKKALLQKMFV